MAIRDLNCSSAVTHIDLENTGIASTAMSITILQAPWMMSALCEPIFARLESGDLKGMVRSIIHTDEYIQVATKVLTSSDPYPYRVADSLKCQ